jgi:hypothetical protein
MRFAPLVALLALALLPASAHAKRQGQLWATVNVCDTAKRPDTIGIRASMPGVPRGARLQMRFRVQYQARGSWHDVNDADSGWRGVGVARGSAVEYGWSFSFARPAKPVTLRGVVRVRWRRGGAVVRQAELTTEAGHRSSAGADPPSYSAATCVLGRS